MGIVRNDELEVRAPKPVDSRIIAVDLATRDAINAAYRFDGLLCYVQADQTNYQLVGGTDNANWTPLATGSGTSLDPVQNQYATVAAMIADQGTQLENYIYFVIDATDDPAVNVGSAWYVYNGGTSGVISNDYILVSAPQEVLSPGGAPVTVYADIPSRPVSDLDGALAYVLDASGDVANSVNGWAFYVYQTTGNVWDLLSAQNFITYNSTKLDTDASPVTVGGIDAGTTVGDLRGINITDFIDLLLFPVVEASVQTPTSTDLDSDLGAVTVEVGTTLQPILTGTFDQGQILNGDNTPGPALVGLPNLWEFSGPGISGTITRATANLTEVVTVAEPNYNPVEAAFGTNQWNVIVTYDAGTGVYTDSEGNSANNLDSLRVADSQSSNSQVATGRYQAFFGSGAAASTPGNSAEVRALADTIFLNASNLGTFDIVIPANTPEVYFSVPAGGTINVVYVESSNADVTSTFTNNAFNVNDAAGNPVAYDNYSAVIGGGGYPSTATYRVTIS